MFTVPKMGYHLILDFKNVTSIDLNSFEELDGFLTQSMKDCGATIEGQQHKQFIPQGVTILYLLSESHFSIHTWPETKSCAIDFYHCGEKSKKNLTRAEVVLCDKLGWENVASSMLIERGGISKALLNAGHKSKTIYTGVKLIHREQSKYQDLRVFESNYMGRFLCLDGLIQMTDLLDDNYTVDLTRLVVQKDKTYNHLLVIGAGDMIIPTYLLEHYPGIKKLTVVEIDQRVVEVTKKYFKFCSKIESLCKEGKLEIVFEDGAKYLKEKVKNNYQYDGLVIDNTDVYIFEGPAASLFTSEFYTDIYSVLKPGAPFSQQVSEEHIKVKWEEKVSGVGFKEFDYIYSETPEYGLALPIGIATKSFS